MDKIKDFIRNNPAATNRAVMEACGCSMVEVRVARDKLATEEGFLSGVGRTRERTAKIARAADFTVEDYEYKGPLKSGKERLKDAMKLVKANGVEAVANAVATFEELPYPLATILAVAEVIREKGDSFNSSLELIDTLTEDGVNLDDLKEAIEVLS